MLSTIWINKHTYSTLIKQSNNTNEQLAYVGASIKTFTQSVWHAHAFCIWWLFIRPSPTTFKTKSHYHSTSRPQHVRIEQHYVIPWTIPAKVLNCGTLQFMFYAVYHQQRHRRYGQLAAKENGKANVTTDKMFLLKLSFLGIYSVCPPWQRFENDKQSIQWNDIGHRASQTIGRLFNSLFRLTAEQTQKLRITDQL